MPPPRTPHEESSDTRIPPPRIRHFERMREIFFVRGKAKDVRIAASGKHRAPCESEERCFMQTDSRMKQKMTNEKDPSTTLGTTIRENGRSHIHFHPAAGDNLRPSVTSIKKYRQVSLTVSDLYPHHVVKAGF